MTGGTERRRASVERHGNVSGNYRLTDAAERIVKTYSGGMRRRLDLAASLVAARTLFGTSQGGRNPRSSPCSTRC